jgi:hypothetical protein
MTGAVFVPSKRVHEKFLNVAVIAALVAGLFGWWVTQWPPRQSQLALHAGQFVSHSLSRVGRQDREDQLILRAQGGSEFRVYVNSKLVPSLETLSGQTGSVGVDRSGRIYRLEVNGVERLAFDTARPEQIKRAIVALLIGGFAYVTIVLLIAYRLWLEIQSSEPSDGAG